MQVVKRGSPWNEVYVESAISALLRERDPAKVAFLFSSLSDEQKKQVCTELIEPIIELQHFSGMLNSRDPAHAARLFAHLPQAQKDEVFKQLTGRTDGLLNPAICHARIQGGCPKFTAEYAKWLAVQTSVFFQGKTLNGNELNEFRLNMLHQAACIAAAGGKSEILESILKATAVNPELQRALFFHSPQESWKNRIEGSFKSTDPAEIQSFQIFANRYSATMNECPNLFSIALVSEDTSTLKVLFANAPASLHASIYHPEFASHIAVKPGVGASSVDVSQLSLGSEAASWSSQHQALVGGVQERNGNFVVPKKDKISFATILEQHLRELIAHPNPYCLESPVAMKSGAVSRQGFEMEPRIKALGRFVDYLAKSQSGGARAQKLLSHIQDLYRTALEKYHKGRFNEGFAEELFSLLQARKDAGCYSGNLLTGIRPQSVISAFRAVLLNAHSNKIRVPAKLIDGLLAQIPQEELQGSGVFSGTIQSSKYRKKDIAQVVVALVSAQKLALGKEIRGYGTRDDADIREAVHSDLLEIALVNLAAKSRLPLAFNLESGKGSILSPLSPNVEINLRFNLERVLRPLARENELAQALLA